ncbi:LANO_0G13476g1_1 [Lachancea nothofagi CBS 11611]|uniref:LANO_0G13476g1_1 n=1 Tax=Lachancea nothofagi CBS 11611 TaxID=1266666 RepID=A0A1G4KK47_9SACH|nr:LANO_0G13476g1_1 [Lachancea nothofagi CBS 11611]
MASDKLSNLEKNVVDITEVDGHSEDFSNDFQLPEPTSEEKTTLRRILGYPKWYVYFICLIEFSERAAYYGTGNLLSNFIQQPLPEGGNGAGAPPPNSPLTAGALGLGLQTSTALNLLLTFLAYCFPLFTGYIADKYWSRMRMLWIGVYVGMISHILFIIGAIPSVLGSGKAALAPCVIGIILLAVATSFVKPILLPTLLSQYPHETDVVKTLDSGERVIIDRDSSLQRMTMTFYWSINVGSFLAVATSYSARDIGYWLGFLIPLVLYMIMPVVLILLRRHIKDDPPSGKSMVADCMKVLKVSFEGNWWKRYRANEFWEYAKPSNLRKMGRDGWKKNKPGFYPEALVQDARITISACTIFLYYVIYNINDNGISAMINSQTATMTSKGVPNDVISNFNPLCIIIFMPILDWIVYPVMRRFKINFKPTYRIFCGFMVAALSQVAGAVIQKAIYNTSPCGNYATTCEEKSPISMWVVAIEYALSGFSECLAMTTGYEIAFERSPPQMKSFVMALFLFTTALSAALAEIVTPSLVDPHLVAPFAVLAVLGALFAFAFLWRYWSLDKVMEEERLERLRTSHEEDLGSVASVYSSGHMALPSGPDLDKIMSTSAAAITKLNR